MISDLGSIENLITCHIMEKMAAAYPTIEPDQIVIKIDRGHADYSQNCGRGCIAREVLTATIATATEQHFNRLPFWRAFKFLRLELSGTVVFQSYKGHQYANFAETLNMKDTVFTIEYKHSIYEA